jgi:hypothetical protein
MKTCLTLSTILLVLAGCAGQPPIAPAKNSEESAADECARLLREEQRKTSGLKHQLSERQQQLRDEQRKSEELQKKIDALRTIDRELRQKRALP